MTNPFTLLTNLIPSEPARVMFVLDENCTLDEIATLASRTNFVQHLQIITNRYDLHTQALSLNLKSHFNDFDFSPWPDNSFDHLYFAISKERAVVHHVINAAGRLLRQGGQLHLAGTKQQGIKTIVKNAGKLLGDPVSAKKQGNNYVASMTKLELSSVPLDDNQYSLVRKITEIKGQAVFSKPGLFGWQKIDEGSAMLANQLRDVITTFNGNISLLDLGCGYGYLSIMANIYGAEFIAATDNNAAAVHCCEKNFQQYQITGEVTADDCAGNIDKLFDLVICHPPFHRGFETSDSLGERFIKAANQHLKQSGKALFVANSFVPIEKKAMPYFRKVEQLNNNQQFKLVLMQGRRLIH